MNRIPSIGEYYLKNGKFYPQSKVSKRFRIGLIIGIILGCLIVPISTSSKMAEQYTWQYTKSKYTEYIIAANSSISQKEASTIAVAIIKWAEYYEVDQNIMFAIAKIESRFDKHAISSMGAMGLLQVMTKVHLDKLIMAKKELHNPEIFDIDTNLFIGTRIFKDCLDKYSVAKALDTCYSAGATNYSSRVLAEYKHLKKA